MEGHPATPLATVIIPCRDEVRFITGCLASIVENGYPEDALEVLVVDGCSTDGTREVVDAFQADHPCVRLLDNPRRTTPVALNKGIREARGQYILWMSAHNTYEPGYIAQCLEHAERTGADNVGGVIVTVGRDRGAVADAIVAALTHRFGVGGSTFRLGSGGPRWVDTVFGGCYRREVFDRVGLFNENLTRSQDMEFNLRLRRAGLRTLLVPTIRSTYHARTRPLEFLSYNWSNGIWAILPFLYSEGAGVSLRHLVPLAFALALTAGVLAAPFLAAGRWLLAAIGVAYVAAALTASADVAWRRRDARFLVLMPFTFAALHLSYGFGSLGGMLQLLVQMPARRTARPRRPSGVRS